MSSSGPPRPSPRWRGTSTALEGAFGRRALAERAKGILMERHSIDEATAFAMLRDHSRDANRKLVDVAAAIVDGHRLLPKQPGAPS